MLMWEMQKNKIVRFSLNKKGHFPRRRLLTHKQSVCVPLNADAPFFAYPSSGWAESVVGDEPNNRLSGAKLNHNNYVNTPRVYLQDAKR